MKALQFHQHDSIILVYLNHFTNKMMEVSPRVLHAQLASIHLVITTYATATTHERHNLMHCNSLHNPNQCNSA